MKKMRDFLPSREGLVLRDKDVMERGSFEGVNTVKSANAGSIKQISLQMEQNKLHNLQTKHELKDFRRKAEQE